MKYLRQLLMKFFILIEKPKLNGTIHVYIPKVDKIYRMNVSSVKCFTFTARWENDEEPEDVNMYDFYGQLDNDLEFFKESREPIFRNWEQPQCE